MIYASSSSVYGGNAKLPFAVEDRADHPVSLYAATKKANEHMSHCYSHLYRIPATGLRFFTVYGPWGRRRDGSLGPLAVLARDDVPCRPFTLRWCPEPVCMTSIPTEDVLVSVAQVAELLGA